jgi:hypothetical protein
MSRSQQPAGYDELGETLGGPVALGYQGLQWAVDIAGLLGHSRADVQAWVEWYKKIHAAEISKQERIKSRHQQKLEALKEKMAKAERLNKRTR